MLHNQNSGWIKKLEIQKVMSMHMLIAWKKQL